MKFLIILLLLIPVITASDEHKSKETHEEDKDGKVIKEDQALSEIVKVNNEFAMNVFNHLITVSSQSKNSPSKNVLVSPVSIIFALFMLRLGSQSRDLDEILERLSPTTNIAKEVRSTNFYHLLHMWSEPKNNFQLQISNTIFIPHTMTLLKKFQDDAQNYYHANIIKTNFSHPKEAEKEINEYMKNKTEGKMKELVKDLCEDTKMVLINHIQLKENWENPFDEKITEGDFHVNKDETVKVPFLCRTGYYNMTVFDEATLVAVPHKGNVTVLFILPTEGKVELNLEDIMNKWTKSHHTKSTGDFIQLYNLSEHAPFSFLLSFSVIIPLYSSLLQKETTCFLLAVSEASCTFSFTPSWFSQPFLKWNFHLYGRVNIGMLM